MRPLSRQNDETRNSALETRIASLERRIIPEPGLPWAVTQSITSGETISSGHFVHPAVWNPFFGPSASASDEMIFSTLPVDTFWNVDATSNIDGSLLIMQRGLYQITGHVVWGNLGPSDTQIAEISVVQTEVNWPPPTAAGPYSANMTVGTHNTIDSFAFGANIDGDKQWVQIQTLLGDTTHFGITSIKLRIALLGGGAAVGVASVSMVVVQLAPIPCHSLITVTDNGLPDPIVDNNPC